jgi:hypothetical protein
MQGAASPKYGYMQGICCAWVMRLATRIIADYRGLSGIQALLGFECLGDQGRVVADVDLGRAIAARSLAAALRREQVGTQDPISSLNCVVDFGGQTYVAEGR